jgi:hypothetical protein
MHTIGRRHADRRRRIAGLLPAIGLSIAGLHLNIVGADDTRLQPGSIEEKRFLQRIIDADNMELKTKIDALRNATGGAKRLEERPRKSRDVRPSAVPIVKVVANGAGPNVVSIGDGEAVLYVEAASVSDDEVDRQAPAKVPLFAQQFRIAKTGYDEMLYGKGNDAAEVRRRLEVQLRSKIAEIDRVCGLTPAQAEKLRLAGRGDIHRFFERVEEVRLKIDAASEWDADDLRTLMQRVMPLIDDIRVLRKEALDVHFFGTGSLFAKALQKVLTPDQAARRANRAQSESTVP